MSPADVNIRLLLSIAAVIGTARLVGWGARKVGQPRVMGEIVAGILLGPSLLGLIAPSATDFLFPAPVLGGLRAIAQVGLVLFMFLVGVHLDLGRLLGQGHRAVVISHASMLLPFGLGTALGAALHSRYAGSTSVLSFSLFFGIAMSITAFPVLARVLQDVGMERTRLGVLSLTCAAVDDVTAWCLLAVVVAVVEATDVTGALVTVGLAAAFVVGALLVVRPVLRRLPPMSVPFAVAFALSSAWLTEQIGIHAIFGAFLAGAILPNDAAHRLDLSERLEMVTTTVLLPTFFVVIGLSTKVGLLDSVELWLVTIAVVAVAVVGKLGGSSVAGRLVGETWRDAVTIGVLMNTRGLTELVILSVGLELGVIDETVFTIMVIMALVTTLMAGPTLRALGVSRADDVPRQPDDARRSDGVDRHARGRSAGT